MNQRQPATGPSGRLRSLHRVPSPALAWLRLSQAPTQFPHLVLSRLEPSLERGGFLPHGFGLDPKGRRFGRWPAPCSQRRVTSASSSPTFWRNAATSFRRSSSSGRVANALSQAMRSIARATPALSKAHHVSPPCAIRSKKAACSVTPSGIFCFKDAGHHSNSLRDSKKIRSKRDPMMRPFSALP